MMNQEIIKCNLCELIPEKRRQVKGHKKNADELWRFKKEYPDAIESKRLLAEYSSIIVKLIMNNHVYKFGDEVRKQQNEGGIGVTLTGVISELKMLMWWITLDTKLKDMNIENDLDDRYVDDYTLLPTELPPGTVVNDFGLSYSEEKYEEDLKIPGDIRTMKIIQEIANSIDENIKVTFDVPYYNSDKKVPILDLKVSLNKVTKKIEYKFYKKPMASKMVTHKILQFHQM